MIANQSDRTTGHHGGVVERGQFSSMNIPSPNPRRIKCRNSRKAIDRSSSPTSSSSGMASSSSSSSQDRSPSSLKRVDQQRHQGTITRIKRSQPELIFQMIAQGWFGNHERWASDPSSGRGAFIRSFALPIVAASHLIGRGGASVISAEPSAPWSCC